MFIGKRGRPDLEPYIAYLCTRVSKSDENDWNKLKRVLQFAKQTVDDKRVIGAKNLTELYTWVDAAYAVHHDMKSQTGGSMSFGDGMIHCKSSKQKLNTKSSTESELVGISDYLPYNLWMKMFLEEQGYSLKSNTLFQDNQSTIKMGTNGRTSCTGNSRHINVRYFFVVDRVKKKELQIRYCPTEMMIADFFTKALQGKLFHKMRGIIMGYESIFTMMEEYFPLKERVENHGEENLKSEKRKCEEKIVMNHNGTDGNANVHKMHILGTEEKGTDFKEEGTRKTAVSWADVVKRNNKNGCVV